MVTNRSWQESSLRHIILPKKGVLEQGYPERIFSMNYNKKGQAPV